MLPVEPKKMMTRRSSSNLCKLANSKDSEGAISTPYPEKGHTKTKNYALNIGKSLEKKLTGCASEHLKYEMKPGKNLVISLSSAAYELAKSYIVEKTQSTEFSNSFASVKESGVDLNNAVVDFRLKFFNRKKDGEIGCIQKFVVNFYNTTSRVMVNGSRVDIFCEEILEPLEQHIFSKCESLDAMNCGISSIIQAIKLKQNQKRAVQESVPQISSNTMTESDNTSQAAAGDLDNSKLSELNSSVERIFFCPICDQAAELETIACEQCDEWYHYSCAGITEKDINKIGKDIPYICECCSDNVLYGTQLEDTSKLTELGFNEKNENNTNISSSSVIREEVLNDLHISQTFKDSFTYTQDAFTCSNEMNGTFNVGHPASPISLQDRCEPDRLFQITESANPCTDKGNTKSDIQVTHSKECGKEKNSNKGTKQAFKSNLQQLNVNEAMNSQHSEQQCDKLQAISGAVGGEKRKSRLKDSKKNSDKHDLDQKIYILDLERKVKEQDKTINLLSKRIDMVSSEKGQDSSEFSPKMDDPVRCGNTQPQSTTQTELVTMEMRMRQLEFSMLQSMAMFTTCTAQLNMQLQNQNTLINNVQNNQFTQGSINPYQPYLQPTGGHPPTISHMGNQPTFGGLYQPPMVSLNGPQLNNVGFHQHPMWPQQSFTGVSQPSMMRPTVVNPSMNGYTHPPVVPPTGIHLVPQPQAIPVFCPQPGFGGPGGLPVGTTMETQQQQRHVVPPPFFSIPPPAMNRAPPMPAYNQSAPHPNSSANNRGNHGIKYQHSHGHLTSNPTVVSIPKERTEDENLSPMGDNSLSRCSERRKNPSQDAEFGSVETGSCLDGGMIQKKRVTTANPEIRSTYPDNQTDDQDTSVILVEDITPTQPLLECSDKQSGLRKTPANSPDAVIHTHKHKPTDQGSSHPSFLVIPGLNLRPPDSPIMELAVMTRL